MNLVSVLFQVQEIKLTEAYLKLKKTLRQSSSYTTKEIEDELELHNRRQWQEGAPSKRRLHPQEPINV